MITDMTESDFERMARETVTLQIDDIIHPSDLGDEYVTWEDVPDDVIHQELYSMASHHLDDSVRRYEPGIPPAVEVARQLALKYMVDDMSRIPMQHLSEMFADYHDAVSEGYWPNKCDKWELEEILEDLYESWRDIPHGYWEDSVMQVEAWVADEMSIQGEM